MSSDFDIEYDREEPTKSFLNTRNILITFWAIAAVSLLVIRGLYAKGYFDVATEVPIINPESINIDDSDGDNSKYETDSSFQLEDLLFIHNKNMLRVIQSNNELKCERIPVPVSAHTAVPQYSKDKKIIYFAEKDNIDYYDLENETIEKTPINNDKFIIVSKFVLTKPHLNELICVGANRDADTCSFRFFNLEYGYLTNRFEKHHCNAADEIPIIKALSPDGARLFYMCHDTKRMFMKDLSKPEENDKFIIETNWDCRFEICRDNEKLIRYCSSEFNSLALIDINTPTNVEVIELERKITYIHRFAFSKNQKILYVLATTRALKDGYELFAFDYEKLLTQWEAVDFFSKQVIKRPEDFVN